MDEQELIEYIENITTVEIHCDDIKRYWFTVDHFNSQSYHTFNALLGSLIHLLFLNSLFCKIEPNEPMEDYDREH